MTHTALIDLLIYLGTAILLVPLFKRLGMGSILGYLAGGALIGPWGLRWVSSVERDLHLGELGVVLLLFIIGLELHPKRLMEMRKDVFGWGSVQVLCTTAVSVFLLTLWTSLSQTSLWILSFALALSSTAFALQSLKERNELATPFGKKAFGILLFQDVAVIPVMALLPLLSKNSTTEGSPGWVHGLLIVGVFLGLFFVVRPLLRIGLRILGTIRAKEIFTAAALFFVLGLALFMEHLGLSMGLGAFIAGLILSDSEYRHELEADIEPFRGLLMGLFFLAVGMSVDFGLLRSYPFELITLALALIYIKGLLLYSIGRFSKLVPQAALRLALTIPQGGEFAFVLLGLAAQQGLLEPRIAKFAILTISLSMGFTPLIQLLYTRLIEPRIHPLKPSFDTIESTDAPVILAGFGRFGQIVGRILSLKKIAFTALDHDSEQVELIRRFGNRVYYGDASRLDLLEAAGAESAKLLVIAIDDPEASIRTAEVARTHFPHLQIFARVRNRQHAFAMLDLGVQLLNRETYGSALEMASQILVEYGVTPENAERTISIFRARDEEVLREQHKRSKDMQQMVLYTRNAMQQLEELLIRDAEGGALEEVASSPTSE